MRWAERPLGRPEYLVSGTLLMGLKLVIDFSIFEAFERPFTPFFYFSPTELPDAPKTFWIAIVLTSLPFMAIGLNLTVRRLRDARVSPWFAALFLLPFLKFAFFVVCAALPPRRRGAQNLAVVDAPYRSTTIQLPAETLVEPSQDVEPTTHETPPYQRKIRRPPPSARRRDRQERSRIPLFLAAILSAFLGTVATFILTASSGLLKEYGELMVIFGPSLIGFVIALAFRRIHGSPRVAGYFLASVMAGAGSLAVISLLAPNSMEGVGVSMPVWACCFAIGIAIGHATGKPTETE